MKIMVSAGEVSGDVHGSFLVRELKKISPDIYFFGMGSEQLAAAGVDVRFDIARRGTIGISEALPNLLPIYFVYRRLVSLLKKEKPDLLLLIDSQGINLPRAKAAKKLGIKTVYYVAPQEWLWGTPKGVKRVAETVSLIISIFEKEHHIYKEAGANSVYFGHPLVDIVRSSAVKEGRGPVIALCPGSRQQEIKGLLPILLKAGEKIQKEIPEAVFLMPIASNALVKEIPPFATGFNVKAVLGHTYDVLAASDLAICTSGTINLEASILGTPNIMIYKASLLTYLIGKYILKIGEKIKYLSMPNLLLAEKVVPEFIMQDAAPDKIAKEALAILKNPSRQKEMKEAFERLRQKLGAPGVIAKCAKTILQISPPPK
jgi:lipid-A-disaccharide synthase